MNLKRLFVMTSAIATGVVVGLAILVGGYLWWDSRPKHRDATSVTGTYDGAYTRKTDGRVRVHLRYVLQNNTREDIHISSDHLTGFIRRTEGSLVNLSRFDHVQLEEVDIPAGERTLWFVPIGFVYETSDDCRDVEIKSDPQKDDLQLFIDKCYERILGGFLFQTEDEARLQFALPPPTRGQPSK